MPLTNGPYTLRASPVNDGVGGEYANGTGIGQIVTVNPEPKIWEINAVAGDKDVYVIIDAFNRGFWAPEHISIAEGPIILSRGVVKWHITPLDTGFPDTFTIKAIGGLIGVDWYVGTDDGLVVLKPIVVLPGQKPPYWQIKPLDN